MNCQKTLHHVLLIFLPSQKSIEVLLALQKLATAFPLENVCSHSRVVALTGGCVQPCKLRVGWIRP